MNLKCKNLKCKNLKCKNRAIVILMVVAMGGEFNEDSDDFEGGYLIILDAK